MKNSQTFTIDQTSLPDLPQLMLATIEALRTLGGSAAIEELNQVVTEREGVSEIEQSYLMPNGRDQRLAYYLAWARTYLKRGGALENSARGVWNLKEIGSSIHNKSDTLAIYARVNEEERQRAKDRRLQQKITEPIRDNSGTPTVELADPTPVKHWKEATR